MPGRVLLSVAFYLLMATGNATEAPGPAPVGYKVVDSWNAPASLWDYASVDTETKRLYVGRVGGVLSVDLENGRVTPILVKSKLVHGVAPLPKGLAAASNGEDDTVSIFNGKTGEIVAVIPAGKGPDSIVYEPTEKLIAVTDEDGGAISLLDPETRAPVARIDVGGKPEAIVSNGKGLLYGNIDDRAEVVVVDVKQRKVTKHVKLPECDRPTGIAYDSLRNVTISACRNGVVNVLRPESAQVLSTLRLGAGPDAVFVDVKRAIAFVPSGGTGTLNVIAIGPDGHGHVTQTEPTQLGSRTGTVDPVTGYVYLPAGKLIAAKKAGEWPSVDPGSFRILVLKPSDEHVE